MIERWWTAAGLVPLLTISGAILGAAALGLFGLDADSGFALAFGASIKLAFLTAAAGYAVACMRRIHSLAWKFMAGGFVGYALGQGCLVIYQLILHVPLPFPSWADVFFVSGSSLLIVALWVFLIELRRTGCPLDLRRRLPIDLAWILGLGGVAAGLIARPVFEEGAGLDAWLSLLYPITDLLLLVPALLLYQVTGAFRGGQIRSIWATLLVGMALFLIGDLLFSLLTGDDHPWLVWAVDMSFIGGYALAARACAMQHDLVHS